MTWWYLAIPTAAFAGYLVYLEIVNRRRAESLRADFNARDRLDPGTWFAAFAGSGLSHERLVEVLSPVARAIGCEVTQLRPTDSFDGTLRWRGSAFRVAGVFRPRSRQIRFGDGALLSLS